LPPRALEVDARRRGFVIRPRVFIFGAACIAAAPVVVLAVLAMRGDLAFVPASLGAMVVIAAAWLLAWIWAQDVARLTETLRHAMAEDNAALIAVAATPRLAAIERVTRGIERLSRALAARAADIGGLLRANEAIIERLPDPLLVLGAGRAVLRANTAARVAFGTEIAAVLRHPGLRNAVEVSLRDGATQTVDLRLPVPTEREVQATVIHLDPPLAGGGTSLVVLSDRTRDRAVERMRADFVANASHELRTPLTSLVGFIATLQGPAADDPPAQRRFLAIMAEQAERMNRLIDDLLSLSRIELVEHQPPSETMDLAEIVSSTAAGFEPRVVARRIDFVQLIAADLPEIVADADQIAQVVSNLIDNAVKYGREGGRVELIVALAVGERWPARRGVTVSVSDDGAGIPRAQVPRLTERFYRVDKGRARTAGGTGLGLAIVKHIVNRHRGQLLIESDEGRGAVFTVWLPVGGDGINQNR
jgi:two-component system phosphate regulon sensor histidine kinase PhoR